MRGWLTGAIDPMGGTSSRGHDELGRLVTETDAGGLTATRAYDAVGRVTERVDAAGTRMRWEYDAAGRITSYGRPGGPPVTIERDPAGRIVAIDEPGSFRHRLAWDAAGRLVERSRDQLTLTWRYTVGGDRAAIAYPDGTATTYTHDAEGRVTGLHHPAVGAMTLERDASGRLVGVAGDGLRARWRYDGGDLVGYEVRTDDTSEVARLTRDPAGRVVAAEVNGVVRHYTYDAAGQLRTVTTPAGEYSYAYDANGRLVREATPAGAVEYVYDPAGRLTVRRQGTSEAAHEYDGAGVRPDATRDSAEPTSSIVVDALGELAEVDGTSLLWDTADPLTPVAWMGGQAVIGAGAPWALAGAEGATWLAPDWQGSIGGPRDPWGAVESGTPAPGTELQLGYRGEVEFHGQVWLRHRVYDPGTRGFLGPDPLAGVPGTPYAAHPYHYAGNNPINSADPLGLRPVTDAELSAYRDQMGRGPWDRGVDFAKHNWKYVAVAGFGFGGLLLSDSGRRFLARETRALAQRAKGMADAYLVINYGRHLDGSVASPEERLQAALDTTVGLLDSVGDIGLDGAKFLAWGSRHGLVGPLPLPTQPISDWLNKYDHASQLVFDVTGIENPVDYGSGAYGLGYLTGFVATIAVDIVAPELIVAQAARAARAARAAEEALRAEEAARAAARLARAAEEARRAAEARRAEEAARALRARGVAMDRLRGQIGEEAAQKLATKIDAHALEKLTEDLTGLEIERLADNLGAAGVERLAADMSEPEIKALRNRLDDLANDIDKGGITPGSRLEAVDGYSLEVSGEMKGPIRRANGDVNPRENGADLVDADGGLWDHKIATSKRGFNVKKFVDKVEFNDIRNGEKIMVNHSELSAPDLAALLAEIDARGLRSHFWFLPPLKP